MAHTKQSRPDYGLGFQAKVIKTFHVVSYSPGGSIEIDLGMSMCLWDRAGWQIQPTWPREWFEVL